MSDTSTARSPIRVLVVDDSATMRSMMIELLCAAPDIVVVGEAGDGVQAVHEAKRLFPDVITMDVSMPRMDGIEAIRQIMTDRPCRIVVVTAVAHSQPGVDLSLRAVEAGALELIAKPTGSSEELTRFGRRLVSSIRLMADVPVVRRRAAIAAAPSAAPGLGTSIPRAPGAPPHRSSTALSPTSDCRVDLVAIAASTGGPPALAAILGALPASYPLPLLVAQHMAPGFGSGLFRWLASVAPMEVRLASTGEAVRGGCVYLPPDSCHLEIEVGGVLRVEPAEGGHCPSADRLLSSVARSYRSRGAGVVLTGMGDDGADGLLAIAREGGITWAQDEESSIVFGMPRMAAERGGASAVLPLSKMPDALMSLLVATPRAAIRAG